MKAPRPSRNASIAAAILMLAAGLGLWGIGHGLPFSYYPDEAHFVKRALSFGSGNLNPHWFHKPALYMYLLFAEYGALFVVGKVFGLWAGVTEFGVRFVRDPGLFYLVGRLTTLAFALGTIAVVIRLGERYLRPGAGLLGGFFLALTAGLISSSQHVKEDVPSMFFATLSLFWVVRFADSGRIRDLLVAAAVGGASAATKAYGMALLPAIGVTVLWRAWCDAPRPGARVRQSLVWLGAAVCVFGLAQFLLAPFSFLDPLGREATFGRLVGPFAKLARLTGWVKLQPPPDEHLGTSGEFGYGCVEYLRVVVSPHGMGIVLSVYAAAGVVTLLIQRSFRGLLLVGYAALFLVVSALVHPGYAAPRHQTPVYPVLALVSGFAVTEFAARWSRLKYAIVAIVAVSMFVPLRTIAARAERISADDTRNAAKRWIESTLPAGTRLVMDEAGPPILATEESLQHQLLPAKATAGKGQFTTHYDRYLELQILAARDHTAFDIEEIRRPWWRESEPESSRILLTTSYDRDMANPLRPVGVDRYDGYVARGFQYAVVHSEAYRSVMMNPAVAARWPSFTRFYRELFGRGELVQEFDPRGGAYAGPVVRVYRLVP